MTVAVNLAEVLGGVLALAYTAAAVPCVVFSPMIFDSPGSAKSMCTCLLFLAILAAPICGGVSIFLSASRLLFGVVGPADASAAPLAAFGAELLVVLTPMLGQMLAVAVALALIQVLQGGSFSPGQGVEAPRHHTGAAKRCWGEE
ncbi:hypothetical protein HYH02_007309 [Chlamydomonas schloesseri]|uniref:Uncharacterized protein n=1 Tax=Chlamydomonas schloesseri TaxID=2026947 RepID=A0A835WHW9_9CHLO|nr:hypothetical protein HYH02_007309 [Chlamydomonas schloesseri]|eukprot:KAG2447853.1 hypothetical protein HYH02_007309 [Chlamydomonas schloesseri]